MLSIRVAGADVFPMLGREVIERQKEAVERFRDEAVAARHDLEREREELARPKVGAGGGET